MAYSVNRVTIVGNVGREPELRQTAHGQAVCNLVVGTDQKWTNKKTGEAKGRTSWHKVVAWDALAEVCAQCMRTGSKVYIDGQLLYEDYQAKDGSPRQKAFIKADQVVVMDGKDTRGLRREPDANERPAQAQPTQSQPWDETHADEAGLPF